MGKQKIGPVRAYRVHVVGFPTTIIGAKNAGKARFKAYSSLQEAGYERSKFGDIQVRRAPEWDDSVEDMKILKEENWKGP